MFPLTKYVIIIIFVLLGFSINAQITKTKLIEQKKIKLGAYYFDGWTGLTNHITESLITNFPERKPKWGWITSTQKNMQFQIDAAATSGISFFSFCWYYVNSDSTIFKNHPLNNALRLYIAAPNRNKLEFNLLIANHAGHIIGPKDWNVVTAAWISYFKNPEYLKVDGKPLVTFFSFRTLIQEFGSTAAVRLALEQLREKAKSNGLKGVNLAACIHDEKNDVNLAKQCGFDILTSYNDHTAGFSEQKKRNISIDDLTKSNTRIWDNYKMEKLPYIPVVTLNWDPRPWYDIDKSLPLSQYYFGYSSRSVFEMISSLRKWCNRHPNQITKDRIAVVYAWNEYGEGAWLTPSKSDNSLLNGLKRALSN